MDRTILDSYGYHGVDQLGVSEVCPRGSRATDIAMAATRLDNVNLGAAAAVLRSTLEEIMRRGRRELADTGSRYRAGLPRWSDNVDEVLSDLDAAVIG